MTGVDWWVFGNIAIFFSRSITLTAKIKLVLSTYYESASFKCGGLSRKSTIFFPVHNFIITHNDHALDVEHETAF